MKAPEIFIDNLIDISGIISGITDRERIQWIKCCLSNLCDIGSIDKIREIVNNPELDD